MSKRTYAFTLIELLVVIAIIAILAAILFPVFAQAKVAAKKATDLSNMKQMGLSMMMYSTDFDDLLPMAMTKDPIPVAQATPPDYNMLGTDHAWTWCSDNDQNPTQIWWTYGETTWPYHKSLNIFRSPNSPNSNGNPGLGNYGVNWNLMGVPIFDPNHSWPLSTTAIDGVADKVLVINGGNVVLYQYNMVQPGAYGGLDYVAGACPNGPTSGPDAQGVDCSLYNVSWNSFPQMKGDLQTGRHNKSTINVTYADGHAKSTAFKGLAAKQGSAWCPNGNTGWACN
ncbi:MAG: prepilin-type N-terminal cleavage/methylation domain-containing protein [Armatimonadetes bacterium]|nr:prepilin-type N-terminal cleavage/methylation domain-containing protein [Armatimonadota bacterium]MBS1726394.1 prepilin-type N-terminal cleavage/methylation domain-containing protein [Armatimonadota bacterium]